MSKLFHNECASRLFATSGTYGEVDIVATDRILVSLTSRNYDTAGFLHRSTALATLSMSDARYVRDLLDQAGAVG